MVAPVGQFDDDFALTGGNTAISSLEEGESHFVRTMVVRGTQKPIIPMIKCKNQANRRKREMRADIIEIVQNTKMKCLVCAW